MFIATIPNRNSQPAILLREGYREDGKVKTRTLAYLTGLSLEEIEALKAALRGEAVGAEHHSLGEVLGRGWRARNSLLVKGPILEPVIRLGRPCPPVGA